MDTRPNVFNVFHLDYRLTQLVCVCGWKQNAFTRMNDLVPLCATYNIYKCQVGPLQMLFFLLQQAVFFSCSDHYAILPKYTKVPHSTSVWKLPHIVHCCQLSYLCFTNMDLRVNQKLFTPVACEFCTLTTAHESFKRYTVSTNSVSRCPRLHTHLQRMHTRTTTAMVLGNVCMPAVKIALFFTQPLNVTTGKSLRSQAVHPIRRL